MFPEWTDPNDIDHYTSDIDGLLKDIVSYPSSAVYRALPPSRPTATDATPEQPTGIVVNAPGIKAAYEVSPGSIAQDGHPVGRQPSYNVLYSSEPLRPLPPQQTEPYRGRESASFYQDNFVMMMFFAVVILGVLLAQARATNRQYENTISMMFMHLRDSQIRQSGSHK